MEFIKQKEIPILLLTGYLGSGKTTLVNHILTNEQGIRFAVIVNDIGEINIDATLIQQGGVVKEKEKSLIALQNGCICCSLQNDLIEQIFELLQMNCFDYVVIEASGICDPEPIAQTLCSIPQMGGAYTKNGICRLDAIITVVDALRMQDEFDYGNQLTHNEFNKDDIRQLVIQQIEFCNLILLNKANEVAPDKLKQIIQVIHSLQPQAEIIPCNHANISLNQLINTHLFDYRKTATSAAWIQELSKKTMEKEECQCHEHTHGHECGCSCNHHSSHQESHHNSFQIQTFTYQARAPFDIEKFDQFIAQWPNNIIRTKGICYFNNNPDVSCIFEQAGQQKQIIESGLWYATLPQEELDRIKEKQPDIWNEWDETYGDRLQKIVFIGQNLDKAKISKMLNECLDTKFFSN